jgi:pimeloyl-ACP methyl ester carboxylesterase
MVLLGVLLLLLAAHVLAAAVATTIIARRIADAHPPGGIFVRVAGGRLHLYDLAPRGDSRAPTILLLHGATSNARDMVGALAGPLSERHRVIAVDRPGHGWSDRPGGRADASPARQAALIAEGLRHLDAGPVVVVAHSAAGPVGTSLALDHRDQVAGLALLAAVTHPWPGGIAWYYALAASPLLGWLFVRTLVAPIGAWQLEAVASSSFAPASGPADYASAISAALVLRPNAFRQNAQDVAALEAFVTGQAGRYAEIRVPLSVIASEEDSVVSTKIHARAIAAAVEGARLTVLMGKGHQIHYTARDLVRAEIERLAAVAAAGSPPESPEARQAQA